VTATAAIAGLMMILCRFAVRSAIVTAFGSSTFASSMSAFFGVDRHDNPSPSLLDCPV
jgi:hypothetical protein